MNGERSTGEGEIMNVRTVCVVPMEGDVVSHVCGGFGTAHIRHVQTIGPIRFGGSTDTRRSA